MMPAHPIATDDFAAPAAELTRRADGALLLRSGHALEGGFPLITDRLAHWASVAPERAAFVECRNGIIVRTLSYRDTERLSQRLAVGLAAWPLSQRRPLLIVAENGIDHALLRIAALRAGLAFAPLSPNLLQSSGGADRLAAIVRTLDPGLVCADDAAAVSRALRDAGLAQVPVLPRGDGAGDAGWPALLAAACGAPSSPSAAPVDLDGVAAVFFTSGSTGAPKGVITTHRMISANQVAIARLWPLLTHEPPRLLDWLPWHHTFGGNDNFHKMLWHGGTLYIDDGRPTPEAIARTVANIEAVRPTMHINVPRGLDLLLDALDGDGAARANFLAALRLVFFAGAGLSRTTWDRLRALVDGHTARGGRPIALVSGWGSTECGSTIALVHFPIDGPNAIGLPLPGTTLKLVPTGAKHEAWVRGPNVTPGYWPPGNPDRSAFDAEGFYRTGDAVRLLDADRPERGLAFEGRVAEDFKLSSGTWVSTGPLRLALLAALAPLARDVAIAGHDQPYLGVLVFLEPDACRAACGSAEHDTPQSLPTSPMLRARIAAAIAAHNTRQGGSSTAVRRAILIGEPPSVQAGEVNDKGHLNQRLALERRAVLVRRLFETHGDPQVIQC